MGYHVPNLREPDSYAFEVLAAILSGGREFQALHESCPRKTACTERRYRLLSDFPGSGTFFLSAEVLPGRDTDTVEKALNEEIVRMQKEEVGERELEKAKNQLEANFIYGQDSLFYQAMLLAQYEIAADWRLIDDYIPSIRKITAADVMRIAQHYLTQDNRTVGILVPLPLTKRQPSVLPVNERTIR